MKHWFTLAVFLVAVCPLLTFGQTDTVYVPGYYESGSTEGTLNTAITDAITAGTLSTKVFKLKLFERYVLTASITVPDGSNLTIVADDPGADATTAPPQIVWSSSGGITTSYIIDCFGDLTMKNVWVLFANTSGNQAGTSIKFEENTRPNGQHGTFDGCLFDYSQIGADGSGAISITCSHFKGTFRNSYFRNMSDPHYRYYGRPVSFPFNTTGWHTDSLTFVNCSFTNFGYALMQEGSEWSDYVSYNHCTFINGVMFCLESTWWHYLSVTNCAFVNMFMYGDIGDNGGNPGGGTFAIDSVKNFGFTPPFTDAERHILFTNSSYYQESWLTDHYLHNPYTDTVSNPMNIPKPMPMLGPRTLMFFDTTVNGAKVWPYMNRKDLYDKTDPAFLLPPTNVDLIKWFLLKKWTDNADTNWAFEPGASLAQQWPLPEVLRVTNTTLKTAAMGGFPVGDLFHWDKAKYNSWKAQEATENSQIQNLLINGITSVEEKPGVPTSFDLSQNYPNPFNPSTRIDYSIMQSGPVSLKVYDLLGREVATLFSGDQKLGRYTVDFDGSRLASGVYFYKLQSGTNSITKKLVLMK